MGKLNGNILYRAQTGVTSVINIRSECHIALREPPGVYQGRLTQQCSHQGWIPKQCHPCLPVFGWIVSAAVAAGTGPQDEGLLLHLFPFVFLSPLSGLKTNGKKGEGGE